MNKNPNQALPRGKGSIVPWYLLVGFGDSKGYEHGLYIRAIETLFEDFDAMLHPKTAVESQEVDLEPFTKTYEAIIDLFQVSWLTALTLLSRWTPANLCSITTELWILLLLLQIRD